MPVKKFKQAEIRYFLKTVIGAAESESLLREAWRLYRSKVGKLPLFTLDDMLVLGKPHKPDHDFNIHLVSEWHKNGNTTKTIARWVGLSRAQVKTYLKKWHAMSDQERADFKARRAATMKAGEELARKIMRGEVIMDVDKTSPN